MGSLFIASLFSGSFLDDLRHSGSSVAAQLHVSGDALQLFLCVRLQSELGAVGVKPWPAWIALLNNDTVWDNVMIQRGSEPQLRK